MGVKAIEFSLVNNCNHSIWPTIRANPVSPRIEQTGFELPTNTSRTLQVPNRWVGQIWARTGCKFNKSGLGTCATGNCASGKIECEGAVDASPVTLVEFTLGLGGHNSYDVSLVYGFNLPVIVVPLNGTSSCRSAGCKTDLNLRCPAELRAANGLACRSGCIAFGTPDHCCRGVFGLRDACKPSNYSVIFKTACPRSIVTGYSYPKSTFSCRGADFRIAFCPLDAGASCKKLNNSPPIGWVVEQGNQRPRPPPKNQEEPGPRLYIRRL
ncbi:unnamed protein product [Thlaspi arvense]|uniref:Thaumatin-like protein n=1 Tax=Thlaspi arvense TaxID=13288 RepID=A0AAU9RID0_THLAR|nr:unnamed protein product [Thlaspi arvense]